MSCTDNTCGTGGWGGPLPGDPDNNITLSAVSAYGGIDVSWTFPTTNAFAVAYAIVYRGVTDDFLAAIQVGQDTDGFYHDRVEPGRTFFYWIEVISINGTRAAPIGPASAQAKATIEQTMRDLTGMIDAGVLAESLKTEIGRIPLLDQKVFQEISDRIDAQLQLTGALEQIDGSVQGVATLLTQEVVERKDGQAALVAGFTAMAAKVDSNTAAIIEEQVVRADHVSAIARDVETLFVQVGDGTAVAAAIKTETDARVAADTALAGQITTAQSALGQDIASAEQRMDTKVSTVDGKVTSIGALYTAKLTVNNLIGGFGVYNNGATVEAGFDVDTFWVGRTSSDKIKPFIVTGGTTYINEAAINRLTFSKLRDESGSVVIENGKMKAQYLDAENFTARKIDLAAGGVGVPRTTMTNGLIQVFDANNRLRVRLGIW